MRVVIGNRIPRGAQQGALAGCGCSGVGTQPNPAPQLRYGQRYGGTNAQACYRGTNGQWICPSGGMNMRARGTGVSRDFIGRDTFRLPGGQFCWQDDGGNWHCEDH